MTDIATLLAEVQDLLDRQDMILTGRSIIGSYRYSTTTGDADPGDGYFRFNHATLASATQAFIDNLDLTGADLSDWIDTFDDFDSDPQGYIIFRGVTNSAAYAIYAVTGAVVDGTGYRKLTLTHLKSGGTWAADAKFSFVFLPTGQEGLGYGGTSATSLAIGTGSKTLTTQPRKAYQAGARIRLADGANPATKWMEGVVTAYNAATGELTFTSDAVSGSGTVADWTVNITGEGAQAAADVIEATAQAGVATTQAGIATTKAGEAAASAAAALASEIAAASAASGVNTKTVRAATTANITLSGEQTIDGVACGAGDLVFVKDQSAAAENGIYQVAAGAWSRASIMDAWAEVVAAIVVVKQGTANGDSLWLVTSDDGGTLGTSAINATCFFSAGRFILNTAGSVGTSNIADDAVTYQKMQNVSATDRLLGRFSAGAGDVEEIPLTAAGRALIDDADPAAQRTTLSAFGKVVVRIFTSSGTYTPTAGMLYALLECVAGGGGGGGCANSTAGNQGAAGAGGAGEYSARLATAAEIGASQAVTIGAGGSAAAAGNNNGGNGGDTSVGALCIAKGGTGGSGAASNAGGAGGAGGVGGTGNITIRGQPGESGIAAAITTITTLNARGGNSPRGFGFGGTQSGVIAGNNNYSGPAGVGYGAGGGGGKSGNGAGAAAGGAGTAGICIITEYCV